MARPLMQKGIAELEALFAAKQADARVLGQLQHELQFRQVPRAIALMEKVTMALRRKASQDPGRQDTLPLQPPPPPALPVALPEPHKVSTAEAEADASDEARHPKQPLARRTSPAPAPTAPPKPTMPADEAFRLLKATPATAWESVEQTRRQLVHRAHPALVAALPPDKRAQVQEDANRVNEAYAALLWVRCKG